MKSNRKKVMIFMKIEVQIILEELRNIESAEGSGAITEARINEICNAHGVSFEEFRSSILEVLADEAGISADELESLSFEQISEVDLDKISGGAGVPDTVKRGAATLMAILNLGSMANSYATLPHSDRAGGYHGVDSKRNQEEYDDDELLDEKAGLSAETVEKWAYRLGIPLAFALMVLDVCTSNNSSKPNGNVKTISVDELNKIKWTLPRGGKEARKQGNDICNTALTDSKPNLAHKCYVHMRDGSSEGVPMYIVGVFTSVGSSQSSILISDDINYWRTSSRSGRVQVFENGLCNDGKSVPNGAIPILWGLSKVYTGSILANVWDAYDPVPPAPAHNLALPSSTLKRGKIVSDHSTMPAWDLVSKYGSSSSNTHSGQALADKLGTSSGPKTYYVHLRNTYKPGDELRIAAVATSKDGIDSTTIMISDEANYTTCCAKGSNVATGPEWDNTTVKVYDNVPDLIKDGIIAGLRTSYRTMKGSDSIPADVISRPRTSPAAPADSSIKTTDSTPGSWTNCTMTSPTSSTHRSATNCLDESTLKRAGLIYDEEHLPLSSTTGSPESTTGSCESTTDTQEISRPSDKIVELKKQRLAVRLSSDLTLEAAQALMTQISNDLLALEQESAYFTDQKSTDWSKHANEVPKEFNDLFKTYMHGVNYQHCTELALGTIGTENMDYYTDLLASTKAKTKMQHTSKRYNRVYRNNKGAFGVLHTTPDAVLNSRAAQIFNILLKTLTRDKRDGTGLYRPVIDALKTNTSKSIITALRDDIKKANAYHHCSHSTFVDILSTNYVMSLDRLENLFIGKDDKEKLRLIWHSLTAEDNANKPNKEFNTLLENYVSPGVAQFLKTCVVTKFNYFDSQYGQKLTDGILFENLRNPILDNVFENETQNGSVDSIANKSLKACAESVNTYITQHATDSTLRYKPSNGLRAKTDVLAGTNATVFSIIGGNEKAIQEYSLEGKAPSSYNKGCILEIPNACVSYVTPYATLFDANRDCLPRLIHNLDVATCPVVNDISPFTVPRIGGKAATDAAKGLIAFSDAEFLYEYTKDTFRRKQAQLLRSRQLKLHNDLCATVLALYMFCQYMILNNCTPPASATAVWESYYQNVGSHACMEGHSPGELPLGAGGVQRVLLLGYSKDDKDDKEFITKACAHGLKINCISEVPKTHAEFIKAFAACKTYKELYPTDKTS